ncbi:MAG: dihydrofolate reductase [Patescibacteria group bacterium]
MIVSLIAAVSDNRAIGRKNTIPWHIKDDLVHFRSLTAEKTMIVGRTTFELLKDAYHSRGKSMPKRSTIIVTSNSSYVSGEPNCFLAQSVDDAILLARTQGIDEVFVAGGASIYAQAITKADRLYLTNVHITIEDGDAFFPDYSAFTKVSSSEPHESDGLKYTYLTLEK